MSEAGKPASMFVAGMRGDFLRLFANPRGFIQPAEP
jgi:hypothetical protein